MGVCQQVQSHLTMLTMHTASALPQDPRAQTPRRSHGSSPPVIPLRPWPAGERQGQSNTCKRGGEMLLEERRCACQPPAPSPQY